MADKKKKSGGGGGSFGIDFSLNPCAPLLLLMILPPLTLVLVLLLS